MTDSGKPVMKQINEAIAASTDQGVRDATSVIEQIETYARERSESQDDRPARLSGYYQAILTVVPVQEMLDALSAIMRDATKAKAN